MIEGLIILFSGFLLIFSVYYLIPEFIIHYLGIGTWRRQYSPGVCLTFDDGPDPEYTPLLLDELKKNNVRACFFVLGEKAEKYPELVIRIHQDGHIIGSHGYYHRHAWRISPAKTWRYWDRSLSVIERIIGQEPEIIRPPWGSMDLGLYLWCLLNKKKIVSWDVSVKDWKVQNTPEKIVKIIDRKASEGSIVLMHDSGGETGAPSNTVRCIGQLCRHIREVQKLPIVELRFPSWSIFRRLVFRIWEKWERLYAKINNIQRIDDHNLFRLGLKHYQGPDIQNDQGEILATKGDLIGEIHFDNIRFQLIGSDLHNLGLRALKQVRQSLPSVAKFITENPEYNEVKVYLGVTLLNKGAKGLGFNVQELNSSEGRILGFFQKILMLIYHPSGRRNTESLGDKPKIVWISKEKLIEKYFLRDKALI